MKENKSFMDKYDEYNAWKRKRAEYFPEFQEPEKKVKNNSWHFEGCPESDKLIIERRSVNPRIEVSVGRLPYEIQTCADCGAERELI